MKAGLDSLRPDQMRFRADAERIRIEDLELRPGDNIKEFLPLLSLRKGRAEKLTRRIHGLFCAMAAARIYRLSGWVSVEEIGKIDGWSREGSTAKLLINELEIGTGDVGIVEQRGRGAEAQLRLRMPAGLIEIGELPDSVRRLFLQQRPVTAPLEDHRPQPFVERELAVTVAEVLRTTRLADRTLLVSPLYQGGRSSMVFAGLSLRALGSTRGEPVATSVVVKLPIGFAAERELAIRDKALQAESTLLRELAGWPGLPSHIEAVQVDLRGAGQLMRSKHGIDLHHDSLVMPALIISMGRPRTVEAVPRLLSSVIDEIAAPTRRLTRRAIHNALTLAERLATLTRLFHLHKRAHRHLSVNAVVLRYELGIFEHILAADLSASTAISSPSDELLYRDLFDLGRSLVHVITGLRLSKDRHNFQPPGFPGRALIRGAVLGEGDSVSRLLFAVSRYLLEASPDASARDDAPTVRLLDQFLEEVEHIHMRHWSQARGSPERRVSPVVVAGGALQSHLSAREIWAASAADPVTTRLVTISHLVDMPTIHRWCERYITSRAWHASIAGQGGMPESDVAPVLADAPAPPGEGAAANPAEHDRVVSAERCVAILRQGFGRSAAREMWKYLWRRGAADPVPTVSRVLRNYVLHWLREKRLDVYHRLDDAQSDGLRGELDALRARLGERSDGKLLVDWIDELKRHTWELDEPRARAADGDDRERPNPRMVTDARLGSWLQARSLMRLVRAKKTAPTEKDIHDVEIALRAVGSPETVSWHILLARAWVSTALPGYGRTATLDGEAGWDRAMRALLVAAGVAASRKLPYEMAATLAAAAYLTRVALATPELCAEFASQGVDDESVRVQAAECALMAADAYLWLDNQKRHHHALLEAVRLLVASAFPERLVHAFQLLSLARNNRLLDWQPPQIPVGGSPDGSPESPESVDQQFERYPAPTPDAGPLADRERRLSEELHDAWSKVRSRVQTSDDPGLVLEHGYFSRYAPGVQHHFGAGGLQIELEKTGTSRGSAVHRLFELVEAHFAEPVGRRLLDFGCGSGEEARQLAKQPERYTVWAVESPVWFAAASRDLRGDRSGVWPTFIEWDPVDYARRICAGAPPEGSPAQVDAVLFRCSLCRVSQRDVLLDAAFKLLRPGGIVLATDWVQTRTTDRITWSRLLDTVRVVDLGTAPGYQQLCKDAGFTRFKSWGWEEVAHTDEPAMHEFLQARLDETRRMLAAERSDERRTPYERAFLLRTRRDLEALTAMSTQHGPLGWLFWAARKDDAAGGTSSEPVRRG